YQQYHWVNHRHLQALLYLLAALGVVRQTFKYGPEITGAFTRAHQRTIHFINGYRILTQGLSKTETLKYLGPNLHNDLSNILLLLLFGGGMKRFIKGQAGFHQRCQL